MILRSFCYFNLYGDMKYSFFRILNSGTYLRVLISVCKDITNILLQKLLT